MMISIQNTLSEAATCTYQCLVVGAIGATGGYFYAKLADLPAGQVAKAFAIWYTAEAALITLVQAWIKDPTPQVAAYVLIHTATTAIGIHELRKRGLLGNKMIIALIACRSIVTVVRIALPTIFRLFPGIEEKIFPKADDEII